jgi:bifunctional UDP-N-acetylglucosamine pyrophosphorylase / glucosamine-1-phosphate N-acetyltransferase
MAVDCELLVRLLPKLENRNSKSEYYITDLVELAVKARKTVRFAECPAEEVMGVNTRAQLAAVEAELQRKLRAKAMEQGATLVAPDTVFLSADTQIGRDVVIEPNVTIGSGVSIGDNVVVRSFSHVEGATVAPGATVGPFARLRPGAKVGPQAHIGNFVEIKNATVEAGAKINHLSYVGDARVGSGANIGAGTITCNYDGVAKHQTDIGKGAFIGSNTSLVAPVKIGEGAYIGSGSVITRDVEADALAVERSPVTTKPGWASRFRAAAAARKAAKRDG